MLQCSKQIVLPRLPCHTQQHKEKPRALLRVGETLWRRAAEGAAVAGVQSVLADGVASVADSIPSPHGNTLTPPPLQLTKTRGSGTNEVRGAALR